MFVWFQAEASAAEVAAISSVISQPCCLIAYKVLMNGATWIFTVGLMGEWMCAGGRKKSQNTLYPKESFNTLTSVFLLSAGLFSNMLLALFSSAA